MIRRNAVAAQPGTLARARNPGAASRELNRVLCDRQTMPANGRRDDWIVEGSDHRAGRRNGLLNNRQGERSVVTRLIGPDLSDPDTLVIC